MKTLAVDTSSGVAAVAVMDNETLLGEYILNHKKTHSTKLMPMVDELLRSLELTPEDIDVYAASIGPGSFTGLRIGVTAVKSMAFAVRKPVIGIPTLDALAHNVPVTDSLVCPVMDARNNQVYTAVFARENGIQANITGYMGITVLELAAIIRGKNRKAVFIGDAVEIHREFFTKELGDACEFVPGNMMLQRASSVAQLAYLKALKGEFENCFDMIPFYLRKSQAEREYDRKMRVEA